MTQVTFRLLHVLVCRTGETVTCIKVLLAAGICSVIVVLDPKESSRVYEENFSLRCGAHL